MQSLWHCRKQADITRVPRTPQQVEPQCADPPDPRTARCGVSVHRTNGAGRDRTGQNYRNYLNEDTAASCQALSSPRPELKLIAESEQHQHSSHSFREESKSSTATSHDWPPGRILIPSPLLTGLYAQSGESTHSNLDDLIQEGSEAS